jgi:hypothetical protein
MKTISSLLLALLAASRLTAAAPAPAHDHAAEPKPADKAPALPALKDGTLEKPDAAWFAQAIASYPLTTCIVAGDDLGGKTQTPQDYAYRRAGLPDRLVRFCCGDCKADFLKDPAKYLKILDEAAAKAKAAPTAK